MEPRPATPPPWLPVPRPHQPPVPSGASPTEPSQQPTDRPPPTGWGPESWRRLTRTRRGAAGLVIAAAAVLLSPFADWSWLPWLAGLGVLLLLRLLRLDGLLRGWVLHLGGLVVVAGLMMSTDPWAWALAASIGVLLAGLVQLPWWRLAAVGAVLCLISGVGFTFAVREERQEQARRQAEASEASFSLVGERKPERVLGALLEGIGQGDVTGACGLLDHRAREAFVKASGAGDCAGAVRAFRTAAGSPLPYDDLDMTIAPVGGAWLADGCRTVWARPPLGGPELGRLEIRESPPPGRSFFIATFLPC